MPTTTNYAFSLPRWRATRWLADAGSEVPPDIRAALVGTLFGTLPIFIGGVVNTLLISAVIAARLPERAFIAWFLMEVVLSATRLVVLRWAHRAAAEGRDTPTDLYLWLAVAWAASVGYGAFISVTSGDWVVATLACLSAAAMVGGICFRNYAAPRLVGVMIALSLGPVLIGAVMSGEWILFLTLFQIPFYLYSMFMAAYRLNHVLVATMSAERENRRKARQDPLTGVLNRTGLHHALEEKLGNRKADANIVLTYIDLDGFKSVNDTYGHAGGDVLLQLVTDRLTRTVRPQDVVSRIGGDEFVVLFDNLDRTQMLGMGTRLIERIGAPFRLETGEVIVIGASAGMAVAPLHGEDLQSLMAAADGALYESKSRGKFRCSIAS